jgi:hypothetical protein
MAAVMDAAFALGGGAAAERLAAGFAAALRAAGALVRVAGVFDVARCFVVPAALATDGFSFDRRRDLRA